MMLKVVMAFNLTFIKVVVINKEAFYSLRLFGIEWKKSCVSLSTARVLTLLMLYQQWTRNIKHYGSISMKAT